MGPSSWGDGGTLQSVSTVSSPQKPHIQKHLGVNVVVTDDPGVWLWSSVALYSVCVDQWRRTELGQNG